MGFSTQDMRGERKGKGRFFSSQHSKWKRKFGKPIKIKPVASYQFLEYHFLNKDDDEIKI